ncbi:hypothetical protein [Corallococcus sp. CA047B]|uniref:hypothetical protein n=1 Tax=Corallococcus sp. CA047B TaxID=2316729 RepID=UPI0011C384C6|nr:hypothetical protein [Corallococcus sp. CA047B]
MFLELGTTHGFDARRSFSRQHPTDGVWLTPRSHGEEGGILVAAIEVVASESPKTILGSIATLEIVSPALGIVLLEEEEIARRMIAAGESRESVDRYLNRLAESIDLQIKRSRQRLQRWTVESLRWRHARAHRVRYNIC